MKNLTCCLLFLFSFFTIVHAQTDKGDWMVGGGLSINTTKDASSFSLAPNIGHFFARGFAAGAEMQITFGKFGDIHSSILGVGPFARYYFELKEPTFKPFVHASFKVTSIRSKAFGVSETETARSFILGLGGAYFINDNVAIDGLAGYNHSKVEDNVGPGGSFCRIGSQVHLLRREVAGN